MRRLFALTLLAACAQNSVGAGDPDLSASADLGIEADDLSGVVVDLRASDLANADLASADLSSPDFAGRDLAGVFDGGLEAGCNVATCMTRTCGPSLCGYHCGACTGAAMACSNGSCTACNAYCADDNGDHICPGNHGFRRCSDGTVRVCICEGVPSIWLCTPSCP